LVGLKFLKNVTPILALRQAFSPTTSKRLIELAFISAQDDALLRGLFLELTA
jgi:hypothetical protein